MENKVSILVLGGITAILMIGVIVLASLKIDASTTQPIIALAGVSLGALSNELRQDTHPSRSYDDDLTILGRAATKSIITDALRQIAEKDD